RGVRGGDGGHQGGANVLGRALEQAIRVGGGRAAGPLRELFGRGVDTAHHRPSPLRRLAPGTGTPRGLVLRGVVLDGVAVPPRVRDDRRTVGLGAAVLEMESGHARPGVALHGRDDHGHGHCTLTFRNTAAALVAFRATATGPISTSPFFTAPAVLNSGR